MTDGPNLPRASAFALAKRKLPDGICVQLDVADLLALNPAWDHAGAWKFLDKHGVIVSVAMIATGIATVKALLETEGMNDEC
jgi:hypothetical protein